jgi:hypothetical protein
MTSRYHFANAGTVEAWTLKAAIVKAYGGSLFYKLAHDPEYPTGKLYDLYQWNALHECYDQIDSIHIKEEPAQMERGILYIVNDRKGIYRNDYHARNKTTK